MFELHKFYSQKMFTPHGCIKFQKKTFTFLNCMTYIIQMQTNIDAMK
jgi:hypothetical protein